MWTIQKPTITASSTFDTCIEGINDAEQKARLEGIRPQIAAAEIEFDVRGAAQGIYLTIGANTIAGAVGDVTASEMEQLYTRHMARQKSRGHSVYDKIMASAVHGQCPFCGHHTVSTLDHTLPKKRHPIFAVTPINLIPCCKDCNHNKGTSAPADAVSQFLNAYYDDVTADRWLYAEIVNGSPPGATYFVHPPNNWDQVTVRRVQSKRPA